MNDKKKKQIWLKISLVPLNRPMFRKQPSRLKKDENKRTDEMVHPTIHTITQVEEVLLNYKNASGEEKVSQMSHLNG